MKTRTKIRGNKHLQSSTISAKKSPPTKFQFPSFFGLAARRRAEARVGVTYRRAAVGTQTRQDAQRWGRQKDEWCLSHFMSVSTIQGLLGCPLAL